MLGCRNVDELKVEQENHGDLAIDRVVWVQGRVVDHSFDELGIHLNDKLLDSDGEELGLLQGSKEAIELELRLRIAGLSVVEGDGSETTGIALPIFSDLEENVSSSVGTRVDCEDDRSVRFIVNGSESRGVNDRRLELGDGFELIRTNLKRFFLASELNQGASDEGIALDENSENSAGSKESSDFRNVGRNWPVLNGSDSRRVGDSSFVGAEMSEDVSARDSDKRFLSAEGSSVALDSLDDTMNCFEVLPNESADPGVLWDSLIRSISELIS